MRIESNRKVPQTNQLSLGVLDMDGKLWDEQLLIHIVRKSMPRFTKSPNLVLIRLVLTEIERFKNIKINKEM